MTSVRPRCPHDAAPSRSPIDARRTERSRHDQHDRRQRRPSNAGRMQQGSPSSVAPDGRRAAAADPARGQAVEQSGSTPVLQSSTQDGTSRPTTTSTRATTFDVDATVAAADVAGLRSRLVLARRRRQPPTPAHRRQTLVGCRVTPVRASASAVAAVCRAAVDARRGRRRCAVARVTSWPEPADRPAQIAGADLGGTAEVVVDDDLIASAQPATTSTAFDLASSTAGAVTDVRERRADDDDARARCRRPYLRLRRAGGRRGDRACRPRERTDDARR